MTVEVRQQAIHPARSYLVQAPAGSGKTELLTQRILSLLSIVDEPEEILAMTFTRKAAAEMRNRVFTSLTMVKPDDSSSHKMHTWELAQAALKRSKDKGWNLAEYPSLLRIMTLDSLTGALARQLPLLSGLGDMPAPSEHTRALCREAAERTLNEAVKDDFNAVELLMLHQDHNTAGLIDLMSTMLENREKWLKYIGEHGRDAGALRRMLEGNMGIFMQQKIQDCDAMIPLEVKAELPLLTRFAALNVGNEELEGIAAWPDSGIDDLEQWRSLASFTLNKDGQLKKTVTRNHGFPSEARIEKQRMLEMLALLADVPGLGEAMHGLRILPETPEFDENQWKIVESMFRLLPRAVLDLQAEFALRGKVDFTEIALRALEAVSDEDGNPSDLLLKLDYRIRHILVDEFQDTSELQIRLLRCLTSGWEDGDGRTLFMVGDPMQSVYRFRKADVGLFLRAADNQVNLPVITPLQLERNFRSSPVIVGWVNTAFKHIFPATQDSVNGAIPYAKASAALTHDGRVQLHIQQGMDDALEAATAVELVRKAIEDKQRVGILARTRKHLHAIMAALSGAGIAFRAVRILPLNTKPEVRALRALMRALLHPADSESWAAILRMPCCGLTTAGMFTLMANDDRPVWEIMQDKVAVSRLDTEASARVTHVKQALEPCMAMSGRMKVRNLVQTAWLRLGMPQMLDETTRINAETVLDLMDEIETGENMCGRVNFALFDERLKALYAAPDASKEAARVELMTMHGAKGLQWDVVILPGLGTAPKGSDTPLLAFTEAPSGKDEMLLMSPRAATRSKDALYDLIRNIEKDKESNESMRLLYVACTRAETELHLLGHVSENSGNPGKNSFMELLYQHGEDCFDAEIQIMQAGEYGETGGRVPLKRVKTVPEALSVAMQVTNVAETEYGWAGSEAAPIGNAVHAVLQQVAETGVETWNDGLTSQAIQFMRRMLLAEGLSGALLEEALVRCEKGLRNALNSEKGQWVLSGAHRDAHCEWALSVEDHGTASHHVMDRSFVDEHGTRWIIDYKTAAHEGGNIRHFLDEEQKRHAPQLQRYAATLKKLEPEREIKTALYFPMLDAWREWEQDSGY
ncbi:MAG: UvrD-helicase domain-containing protein [Mariprofundaceae bacterium]|nr:UvrD-helicase domain-containing protein [Mariprofundaceae bacterium]